MKAIADKLLPAGGLSTFVHRVLLALIPLVIFALIRIDFVQLALSVVILSKWRMFAVRPRFWPAIIRANSIDLMVGLSIVLFMAAASVRWWQIVWLVAYEVWLLFIKPSSNTVMAAAQAIIGQLAALTALYVTWSGAPLYGLVLMTGLICYLAARHFFDSFDEPYTKLIAYLWGYFGAALMWVLGHWLLFYGPIAQITLLLSVIGYGLAVLYYFDHIDKLTAALRRQFLFVMFAIIVVVLIFSNWGDKVV